MNQSSTGKFRCACTVIQNLFTEPHCDNPSKKLVRENDCKRVGWIKNPEITVPSPPPASPLSSVVSYKDFVEYKV